MIFFLYFFLHSYFISFGNLLIPTFPVGQLHYTKEKTPCDYYIVKVFISELNTPKGH